MGAGDDGSGAKTEREPQGHGLTVDGGREAKTGAPEEMTDGNGHQNSDGA